MSRPEPPSDAHDLLTGFIGDARELAAEVVLLREALSRRMSVEQATGVLIARCGIPADAARRQLDEWASDTGVALSRVAEAVLYLVGGHEDLHGTDSAVRALVLDRLRVARPER